MTKTVLMNIVISVFVSLIVFSFFIPSAPSISVSKTETAYDRVMQTKTLRCGYFIWPPHFQIDMKTGQKSGVYYDVIESLGRTLDLKIEWTQEYSFGTQIETLKSGKVDALCADGPWTRSALPYLDYTIPYYFVPGYLYGDKKNPKLSGIRDITALNTENYTLTSIDGDGSESFTQELFPKIKRMSLPSTSDPSLMVQNILAGKADIMWNDPMTVRAFPKNQQDRLMILNGKKPIGVFPFVISVQKNQDDVLRMLNQGIDVMRDMGVLDRIMKKYDFHEGDVFLPTAAYFSGIKE